MKVVKYGLFSLLLTVLMIGTVNAASLKVVSNKSNITVGGTVTVTVTASGADGWEYCLDYDSSMFSLESANTDTGNACVKTGSVMIGYSNVSYKLKARKSGSSKIGLKGVAMYNEMGENISASAGAVTVTARTQAEIEASYSDNADLKSLNVSDYEISPSFDKDILNYSLEVPNEVDKITINAIRVDNGAHINGYGEKELLEGNNKFEIVVTAEKGNKKTYVINVLRKELNPIKKVVDGNELTVVRKADSLVAPTYYAQDKITIDDEEIPAWKSEITGYTLIALKDNDGNVDFYKYDNGNISSYTQLSMEAFIFIKEDTNDKIKGYDKEKEVTINDKKIKGYVNKDKSNFVLVYGINASNGEKGWYVFDEVDKTFQRYNEDTVVEDKNGLDLYFVLTIVFASVSAISIILLIMLMSKNAKIRNKNEKLISIIEDKKEKREKKIADRFDSFSDLDEDELRELEETIKLQREQIELKKADEESENLEENEEVEDTEDVQNNEEENVIIDPEQEIINNIAKANDESFDDEDQVVTDKKKEKKSKKEDKSNDSEEEIDEDNNISDVNIEDILENNVNTEKEEVEEVKEDKTMSFTQRLIEDPVNENLSKREIRRLEKLKRLEEKEELKKMQEDFLSTNNYDVIEEDNTSDDSKKDTKKGKRKRK